MANDFYQHSGHPGTRAPRSSALLRAEFAAIEDGFDKLPDVGTANLFTVTDGSAMVGKTAAQAKVILSLGNVPNLDTTAAVAHTSLTNNPHRVTKAQVGLGNCDNTADASKPISTLTQAALDLKVSFSNLTSVLSATAGNVVIPLENASYDLMVQWGIVTTHATPGTVTTHSFGVAFDVVLCLTASAYAGDVTTIVTLAAMTITGFNTYANKASVAVRYIGIGAVSK